MDSSVQLYNQYIIDWREENVVIAVVTNVNIEFNDPNFEFFPLLF